MKSAKSEKKLDIARSELIKSFNSLAGILKMKGLSRKVEEFLPFVEIRLGGALGLMKTFKLR
ncbi:hypothetical protein J5U23_01743 [Saccharolobus shibatae B12]|uniref:Uncharacterized protein n=1 Tax=Saccharolobus shibatae (strain ATCC 51178 / DSM 5389 / JCM 8931 / NBRC 15437 / B12) TaxID=523848 RepID=A0A8F5GTE6_SACSH|nr:hypothetical protein [Saccharolobus shibatae]QXJ28874.1 hypothetical protein J5U23_01743 [Saccharolobus shibatae B12]